MPKSFLLQYMGIIKLADPASCYLGGMGGGNKNTKQKTPHHWQETDNPKRQQDMQFVCNLQVIIAMMFVICFIN